MNRTSSRIIRSVAVLAIAGAALGLFRQEDTTLSIIVAICILLIFSLTCRHHHSLQSILLVAFGTVLTGLIGTAGEYWGISNGYWEYHDLPDQRSFARWLPFAWMGAFLFLYRLELFFVSEMKFFHSHQKLILAAVLSIIFPTWGEIVAIQSGVWTYNWPYQLLGVPLLAILLLALLHTSVFFLLILISRKYRIKDSIFYS